MKILNDLLFGVGATAYDLLTGQDLWREHAARMLDHAEILVPGPRVLDVGCGPGPCTFVLAERLGPAASVVGVDISQRMIARARSHHGERFADLRNVRFLQADATDLPFEDGAFDLAVGHSFLYLVSDREGVLREVRRVMAPGGHVVFMEPARDGSLFAAGLSGARAGWRALSEPLACARFVSSMLAWRLFSAAQGRLDPEMARTLLEGAGFADARCSPTLGGLGLHCSARVPG